MSLKTLLFTAGALALAACDSPTAPRTVPLEAMVLRPPPILRLAERIAFVSARAGAPGYNEIYVMNQVGGGLVRLTNSPGYDAEPALSHDGSKIAFASFREGTYCCGVYVMNAADGSGVARLTSGRSPAWSPNGLKIAFTRSDANGSDIYVMNADGSGIVQLTNTPGNDDQPAWSPDGSKIAFRSWRDGSSDIYVMNAADGSGVVRLTTDPSYDEHPAWSPDGSKIVFASNRTWNSQIYVMNAADGSGVVRVATNTFWDYDPTWSPDGSQIAFTSRRDGNDEIYVMNASDGSGVLRLTTDPAFDGEASWARRF